MKANKCSLWVRKLPLERFRLPDDGRKWKQAARTRKDFLFRISSYANGDGTFVRNGRNYSPSFKTLNEDYPRGTFTRHSDSLQRLMLLSWTREHHYDRRVYLIPMAEASENQYPDSSGSVSTADESVSTFDENSIQIHQDQYPDSSKSVSTMVPNPSCPSKAPSKEPSSRHHPVATPHSDGVMERIACGAENPKAGGQKKQGEADRVEMDDDEDVTSDTLFEALREIHAEFYEHVEKQRGFSLCCTRSLPKKYMEDVWIEFKKLGIHANSERNVSSSRCPSRKQGNRCRHLTVRDFHEAYKCWFEERCVSNNPKAQQLIFPLKFFAEELRAYVVKIQDSFD